MNNLLIIDELIPQKKCDLIINTLSKKLKKTEKAPRNYSYYDISNKKESAKLLENLSSTLIKKYKETYPEVNITQERWVLQPFKFKKFKPGKYYDTFHSEQTVDDPRVLSIIIYLSDHNCGTEFLNNLMVKSIKGRALLFPPFWTHAHRGQPCPDNKNRYILSAYAVLEK